MTDIKLTERAGVREIVRQKYGEAALTVLNGQGAACCGSDCCPPKPPADMTAVTTTMQTIAFIKRNNESKNEGLDAPKGQPLEKVRLIRDQIKARVEMMLSEMGA